MFSTEPMRHAGGGGPGTRRNGRCGVAGEIRRLPRPHHPAEALVGPRLRAARQAAGLTLAAVAAQAGLTKGFLSRLERDEVSPSVATLVTVCGIVGISVGSCSRGRPRRWCARTR